MTAPVLYVDDDAANLLVFQSSLQAELPLLTASGGTAALELLRSHEVSVLLTDQRMPGMSGVELIERARVESPDTVRMLITAYSDLGAAIDSINRGQVHLYLRKPWELRELRVALRDARERYLVGRRLRELEGRLRATERVYALGLIAAGIAHEVRSPLAALRMNVELTRFQLRELCTEAGAGGVTLAQVAARLAALDEGLADADLAIDAVADISKAVELPTRSSSPGAVDLAEVVTLTARSTRGELHRRGLLELEVGAVPPVLGSRTQLGQVVLNLVVNALEALAPELRHRNRVGLRLGFVDGLVVVEVKDNGPGIPEEVLARIFDPFFTTKQDGGTGLGLAISRQIVVELGGTIEARSQLGVGTTFTVRLPAHRG